MQQDLESMIKHSTHYEDREDTKNGGIEDLGDFEDGMLFFTA